MVKNKFKEKLIKTMDFGRRNWKEILIGLGITAAVVYVASQTSDEEDANYGYTYDDEKSDFDDNSNDDNSMKFTYKWFKNATDDELTSKREEVRLRYIDGNNIDIDEADRLYDVLHAFDAEMIDRANSKYEKEYPDAQPRHREHGWYLPNDD